MNQTTLNFGDIAVFRTAVSVKGGHALCKVCELPFYEHCDLANDIGIHRQADLLF